jgi:hypothetical protein
MRATVASSASAAGYLSSSGPAAAAIHDRTVAMQPFGVLDHRQPPAQLLTGKSSRRRHHLQAASAPATKSPNRANQTPPRAAAWG